MRNGAKGEGWSRRRWERVGRRRRSEEPPGVGKWRKVLRARHGCDRGGRSKPRVEIGWVRRSDGPVRLQRWYGEDGQHWIGLLRSSSRRFVDWSLCRFAATVELSSCRVVECWSHRSVQNQNPSRPSLTHSAWYNAISAFMILFILVGIVALYFYFRRRGRVRRRVALGVGRDADAAERVPLGRVDPDAAEEYELDDAERGAGGGGGRSPGKAGKGRGRGKGKGRGEARKRDGWENGEEEGEGSPREVVFALGDDEDR